MPVMGACRNQELQEREGFLLGIFQHGLGVGEHLHVFLSLRRSRTFNKQYVLAKRDSVMKANIPGTEPRMYMATDTLCTSVKPIAVKGEYAMETRGLWKMEHDAMGGPFVSHSRVDTLNNRVVVAEGFVYAPEKMKRGLIRRLEAALYTLCLPGEQARELKASIPEVSVVAGKEQE